LSANDSESSPKVTLFSNTTNGATNSNAAAAAKKATTLTLLPPFVAKDFLDTLQPEGVFKNCDSKKVRRLYVGFIRSPHFEPWFRQQRAAVVKKCLEKAPNLKNATVLNSKFT